MQSLTLLQRSCAGFLGALRAVLVALVLVGVPTAGLVHAAERRLGDALEGVGVTLARLPGLSENTPVRQLTVNGVELSVTTLTTHTDLATALERLRGLCTRGGLEVPELLREDRAVPAHLFDGVFERASENEGVLACFETGAKLSLGELSDRLTELRETGDLGALGALRYALLRRTGDTTTVLVLTTEGSVPLATMFPAEGDAPGFDPQGLPRPRGTRRVLSAAIHDAPYGLTLYESASASPRALLDAQAAELSHDGWSSRREPERNALVGQREERAVVWNATVTASGRTFLSVAELARR